jgi:U4/U6 small nuclear ribonucleoprotein PRP4
VAKQYKLKKLSRSVPIPTNDNDVKIRLRELGKPIILFGEKNSDRRERLKKEVLAFILKEGKVPVFKKLDRKSKQETIDENEIFYTEGPIDLKNIRMEIAQYSIPRATYRLEVSKKKFMEMDRIQDSIDYENFLENHKNFEFISSQLGDERGCAKGSLSKDDSLFGVAGWSGNCSIFETKTLKQLTTLKGHTDKVNHISFHPEALVNIPEIGPNVATASSDGLIKLWTLKLGWETQKSANFKGHEDRVNSVDFHPMGKVLASTSHDKTWRLWDLETKKELLLQEGHISPVYPLSFQKDGALLATGDLSGIGLVWDLRTGKCIMPLEGHVKQITCLKFSNNCYQIVSGSDDNTMKIWDLRRRGCIYTIPAHNQAVSDVCFESLDSRFVISCSYDSSFKMWNNRDWSIVQSFTSSTEGKLTSISITNDNKSILTTSLDRTIKLWELKNSN